MFLSLWIGARIAAAIDLAFLAALGIVVAREIIAGNNTRNLKVLGVVALLFARARRPDRCAARLDCRRHRPHDARRHDTSEPRPCGPPTHRDTPDPIHLRCRSDGRIGADRGRLRVSARADAPPFRDGVLAFGAFVVIYAPLLARRPA
jgi:hypothetical protein